MSRAAKCFLLVAFAAILAGVSGCSTNEPQNASVRPWNAPQTWESGLPIDMGQHE
jgi:hypothetical protein